MDENTLQIITNIYDSIIDPSVWNDVLSSLVKLTNSESGLLLSNNNNPEHCGVYENYNIDPYWLYLYDEHYYQYDPSMEVLARAPNTVLSNHVVGSSRNNLAGKHRVFYNEVLLPQKYYHSAGCCMVLPGQNHHALILTRNKNQGDYTKDRLRQLKIVTTHISKALYLSQKMWEQGVINETLSGILGVAEVGVILLNHIGRTVYISEKAEIDINDTKALKLQNGTISIKHLNNNTKLQKLISDSVATALGKNSHGAGCLRLVGSGGSLHLVVTPVSHHSYSNNLFEKLFVQPVYAAIFISKEKESTPLPRQVLKELYGLTMAEANVVANLAEGLSLQEIAELNCRSKETIRSQLKSAMGKTSTKQQSDLVRLVTMSIARFIQEG